MDIEHAAFQHQIINRWFNPGMLFVFCLIFDFVLWPFDGCVYVYYTFARCCKAPVLCYISQHGSVSALICQTYMQRSFPNELHFGCNYRHSSRFICHEGFQHEHIVKTLQAPIQPGNEILIPLHVTVAVVWSTVERWNTFGHKRAHIVNILAGKVEGLSGFPQLELI